jgi:hypothetical protein
LYTLRYAISKHFRAHIDDLCILLRTGLDVGHSALGVPFVSVSFLSSPGSHDPVFLFFPTRGNPLSHALGIMMVSSTTPGQTDT